MAWQQRASGRAEAEGRCLLVQAISVNRLTGLPRRRRLPAEEDGQTLASVGLTGAAVVCVEEE
jgi:hypothetical protein